MKQKPIIRVSAREWVEAECLVAQAQPWPQDNEGIMLLFVFVGIVVIVIIMVIVVNVVLVCCYWCYVVADDGGASVFASTTGSHIRSRLEAGHDCKPYSVATPSLMNPHH